MENKCITCNNREKCPFFSADPEDTECVYDAMALMANLNNEKEISK